MPDAARAIIVNKGKILLIHRKNHDAEYYVAPEGKVEPGESFYECVKREIKEETNLDCVFGPVLWDLIDENQGQVWHLRVYSVKSFKGELKLGGPEAKRHSPDNSYSHEWIPFKKIENLVLYPQALKDKLLSERLT